MALTKAELHRKKVEKIERRQQEEAKCIAEARLQERRKEIENRWKTYTRPKEHHSSEDPYRYSHKYLMQIAKKKQSKVYGTNVTDFTESIYGLYLPPPNIHDIENAKREEVKIHREKWFESTFSASGYRKWERIYRDYSDLKEKQGALRISALQINGEPMIGRPDLVYRNKANGEILIIEIKIVGDMVNIPSDGWPNIRAQLWAYAHADEFKDTPRIHLVGDIWRRTFGCPKCPPEHCKTWKWFMTDYFDRANMELFKWYGGNRV